MNEGTLTGTVVRTCGGRLVLIRPSRHEHPELERGVILTGAPQLIRKLGAGDYVAVNFRLEVDEEVEMDRPRLRLRRIVVHDTRAEIEERRSRYRSRDLRDEP